MIDINKEAEEYAKKQCDDMYNKIGLTGAQWGWETKLDFIAGHNSKATQAKVIQGQIDAYQDCLYYIDENRNEKYIHSKIQDLQQQLKELENE
jgi:hypothetical protein